MTYLSSKARIAYIGFYFVHALVTGPRSGQRYGFQGVNPGTKQAGSEVFQVQVKKPKSKMWSSSPAG